MCSDDSGCFGRINGVKYTRMRNIHPRVFLCRLILHNLVYIKILSLHNLKCIQKIYMYENARNMSWDIALHFEMYYSIY